MKYISIGMACFVKQNIDKHKGNCITLFFDWLITSMNSVITILDCNNINDILFVENIVRDINDPYHLSNSRITIKSLDLCSSIHDVLIDYTDTDILNFIDKYTRRFNRIIEYIKSNEKICFIRYGYVHNHEIDKFTQTIKKINPNCDFTLVVINHNKENNTTCKRIDNHVLSINIHVDITNDNQTTWCPHLLNWENIFLDIENNIN